MTQHETESAAGRPALVIVPAATRRVPPVRRFSDQTRERVRALFEGGEEAIGAIAAATGVSESTIGNWARTLHWMRPEGAPPRIGQREPSDLTLRRQRLVARLYRALGRQLDGIDARARSAGDGDSDSAGAEKDARQARAVLQAIRDARLLPWSLDAGMDLALLDEGILKPT